MSVIEVCAEADLATREQAWISATKINGRLLNSASQIAPRRQDEETKRLISIKHMGRPKLASAEKLMFFRGEKLQELLDLRRAGWGVVQLARHFGTDKSCVRRTLNGKMKSAPHIRDPYPGERPTGRFQSALRPDRRKLDGEQVIKLKAMRSIGHTWKEIAGAFGCHVMTAIYYNRDGHEKRMERINAIS